ncbi:MAG: ABC transporter substrate-binding protein [Deltaproteobacteria bacterium]|nr:ABC transporter substrate-binding protein [Deltaproteobacteria bacterium]
MRRIGYAAIAVFACATAAADAAERLRVGYFPNLTHAVPILGLRQGRFAQALGDDAVIEPRVFNAGPAAMEALLAGELDLAYLGPGPAITGFVRSKGRALRIVAGAASGGASLVVRGDRGIAAAKDLAGRRLASPQIGNTQDVALRIFLREHGLQTRERGGPVSVLPLAGPEILMLFRKGEIDGAWTPEPWAALLRRERGALELVDERALWPQGKFPTTVVVATRQLLLERPMLVERWLRAQIDVSRWIAAHAAEARAEVNAGLRDLTTRDIPVEAAADAWSRLAFGEEILGEALAKLAGDAQALGYLPSYDVAGLVDRAPLERALAAAPP